MYRVTQELDEWNTSRNLNLRTFLGFPATPFQGQTSTILGCSSDMFLVPTIILFYRKKIILIFLWTLVLIKTSCCSMDVWRPVSGSNQSVRSVRSRPMADLQQPLLPPRHESVDRLGSRLTLFYCYLSTNTWGVTCLQNNRYLNFSNL